MTNRELAIALADRGLKLEAIGELLGISRQGASELVRTIVSSRNSLGNSVVYPNLLEWSIENKCTRHDFLKRMGLPAERNNEAKLYRILTGKQMPDKSYIDKMLKATGLSYEAMFGVFSDDD